MKLMPRNEKTSRTQTSVQHFFFLVADGFDDLQDRLKQTKVAESPRLVIELFSSGVLRDSNEYVRWRVRQAVEQRILLGLLPQVGLETFKSGVALALQAD